jgi:hypothetical protein
MLKPSLIAISGIALLILMSTLILTVAIFRDKKHSEENTVLDESIIQNNRKFSVYKDATNGVLCYVYYSASIEMSCVKMVDKK